MSDIREIGKNTEDVNRLLNDIKGSKLFFTDKERTSHKPKFKDFFIMQKELRKKKLKKNEKQQQDKKR